jgi:hypothetical protein
MDNHKLFLLNNENSYNFARFFLKLAGVAQSIEHQPSKLRVAGLSPVSRSF